VAVLTGMVLLMYDDNIGNAFCILLENMLKEQDIRIKELLQGRTDMAAVISKKEDEIVALKENMAGMSRYILRSDKMLDELYEQTDNAQELFDEMLHTMDIIETASDGYRERLTEVLADKKEMELTILALQVQAAESEDRADEEKRKRLQLLMRV